MPFGSHNRVLAHARHVHEHAPTVLTLDFFAPHVQAPEWCRKLSDSCTNLCFLGSFRARFCHHLRLMWGGRFPQPQLYPLSSVPTRLGYLIRKPSGLGKFLRAKPSPEFAFGCRRAKYKFMTMGKQIGTTVVPSLSWQQRMREVATSERPTLAVALLHIDKICVKCCAPSC